MVHLAGNLKFLRKKAGKTQDALSSDISIGRTTIANYEAGISEPNLDTILLFAKYFGISIDDILSSNLEKKTGNKGIAASLSTSQKGFDRIPQVVTVDSNGNDNILYVPIKARAGYLLGYGDPEFMETLPSFRLPGLNNATFRMFEVDGPSMAPNILNGDRVVGEWIDDLKNIVDNHVYIIVHKGGVAVKRVLNRVKERGKFFLKSDTIAHRQEFPIVEIDPEDINEMWYARLKISSDFTEPTEVYHRITDLEADMQQLKKQILGEK